MAELPRCLNELTSGFRSENMQKPPICRSDFDSVNEKLFVLIEHFSEQIFGRTTKKAENVFQKRNPAVVFIPLQAYKFVFRSPNFVRKEIRNIENTREKQIPLQNSEPYHSNVCFYIKSSNIFCPQRTIVDDGFKLVVMRLFDTRLCFGMVGKHRKLKGYKTLIFVEMIGTTCCSVAGLAFFGFILLIPCFPGNFGYELYP